MKIEEIKMRNFRGNSENVFMPNGGLEAIIGATGSGKSSIMKAMEFVFCNPLSREEELKKKDTSKMEVEIKIDGTSLYGRRVATSKKDKSGNVVSTNANSFMIDGVKKQHKAIKEYLESEYGVNAEQISKICSTSELERMDKGQLSEFLTKAIPNRTDIDTIIGYGQCMTDEAEETLRENFPAMPETFGKSELSSVLAQLKDERYGMKKLLDEARLKTQTPIEKPSQTLKELERALEENLKALGSVGAVNLLHQKWEQEKEHLAKEKKEIAELEEKLTKMSVSKPDDSKAKEDQQTLDKLLERKLEIQGLMQTLRANIEMYRNTLDNLDKKVCPISDKLVCTTDKTSAKEELEELISSNEEGIEFSEMELDAIEEEIADIRKRLSEYNTQLVAYNQKLALMARLDEKKKSLKPLSKEPTKEDESVLRGEKAALEALIREAKLYEEYELAKKQERNLEKRVSVLNECCTLLDKRGAITAGVNNAFVSIFNDVLEQRCQLLDKDILVELVSNEGFDISFTRNGVSRLAIECSDGEKAITYFLVADMVNQLTGFPIIFFDNIDKLDKSTFQSVVEMIKDSSFVDMYEHIFLMGIDHDDTLDVLTDQQVVINYL